MMRRLVGLFVFSALLGGMPSSVWAQTPMHPRIAELVNAMYAGVNPQDDTARRIRIIQVCEQAAAEGLSRWGNKKRAGLSDDFRSPDSLAYLEDNGTISIWDVQLSSGAIDVFPGKAPNYPMDSPANSTFMPCQPVNHLTPQQPPPPTPGQPPVIVLPPNQPVDLSGLNGKLDAILEKVAEHDAKAEAHWAEARGIWEEFFKPFLTFTTKYVLPALGGILVGMEAGK